MARSSVGLDIGSSAVRAVEVRRGRRGTTVRRAGRVPLPAGAVEGGLVRDQAAVAAALRELWSTAGFSTREVRLGVGSGSVLVRQLELDWMPEPDLRRSLRYQVADLLPVPVDDANLAHVTLDGPVEGPDPDRRLVRILLVATAREVVDGLVRAAHAAKLRAELADLSAFAALRAADRHTAPVDGDVGGPSAVVDIGAQTLTVVVHDGGRPQFVRVVPGLGGSLVSQSLVDQTGCTWEAAEQLKRTPGALPAPGEQPRTKEQAVLQDAVGRLLGEIRNTLEYHAGADPGRLPRRLVLAGGGSLLPGLRHQATAVLRSEVALLEGALPSAQAETPDGGATDAELAVAVGLGLGVAA